MMEERQKNKREAGNNVRLKKKKKYPYKRGREIKKKVSRTR